MLIAEDLLLLLTDDESGKHTVSNLDLALAGAVLVELAERRKVDVAGVGEAVKEGRIVVRDATSTGDAVLDETLRRCVEKQGKKPDAVLSSLSKGLRDSVLTNLVGRGILRAEEGRVLGLFPTTRWPAVDVEHEARVRAQLGEVLSGRATPDSRTAALVGLLSALDAAHKVVDPAAYGASKKMIRGRAKEIRETAWAAGAVAKAIEAIQAAVTAAIIASSVATTSGYGST